MVHIKEHLLLIGKSTHVVVLYHMCSVLHGAISRSSQCSTTGVTKAVVCGMVQNIKEPLLLIGKSSLYGDSGFFLSHYLCGTLPYA